MIAKIINNTLRTKLKLNNFILSNGFALFKKEKTSIKTNKLNPTPHKYNHIFHQG